MELADVRKLVFEAISSDEEEDINVENCNESSGDASDGSDAIELSGGGFGTPSNTPDYTNNSSDGGQGDMHQFEVSEEDQSNFAKHVEELIEAEQSFNFVSRPLDRLLKLSIILNSPAENRSAEVDKVDKMSFAERCEIHEKMIDSLKKRFEERQENSKGKEEYNSAM